MKKMGFLRDITICQIEVSKVSHETAIYEMTHNGDFKTQNGDIIKAQLSTYEPLLIKIKTKGPKTKEAISMSQRLLKSAALVQKASQKVDAQLTPNIILAEHMHYMKQ